MRLSGVDPSIIRELSGIYKPFIKAFKELISNAYDADAKNIVVSVSPSVDAIEVDDDGNGMTPFEFHRDFARLGGSSAWLRGGRSPGGRERIGYKGIGFLSVARYCSKLEVETRSMRPFRDTATVAPRKRKSIPLADLVAAVVPLPLLKGKVGVTSVAMTDGARVTKLRKTHDYYFASDRLILVSERSRKARELKVSYEIDCRHLLLRATLDFDYLLSLEHRADLRLLEDFCSVQLSEVAPAATHFTRIRLHKLKEFVVRELSAPAAKGKARNIASKSGKDQFVWRLARSAPIRDDIPDDVECAPIRKIADHQAKAKLPALKLRWRGEEPIALRRPVYLPRSGGMSVEETVIPVDIQEGPLHVVGDILARSEVIYPGELRGVAVRVRNVTIGDASFLGLESLMSGPRKAALSQIAGELLVLSGLEAADAINPGRESFYEESTDYRALRRALFGSEDALGGLIGGAIRSILDRIHVRSQVTEHVASARRRRQTLEAISTAVSHYSSASTGTAEALAAFFSAPIEADGLSKTRDVAMRPGHRLGGFEVESAKDLDTDYQIDFQTRRVRMDFSKDLWNTTVYLDGHYYQVHFKVGKPEHPICEFDNSDRKIFVNWAHPAKQYMDDIGFLKSAILLRLATHAAPADANEMMGLALGMLAFRAE